MKFPCKVYVEFSNLARVLGGGRLEQNWMKGFRQIARLSTSSKTKWPESVLSGSLDLSDFFSQPISSQKFLSHRPLHRTHLRMVQTSFQGKYVLNFQYCN